MRLREYAHRLPIWSVASTLVYDGVSVLHHSSVTGRLAFICSAGTPAIVTFDPLTRCGSRAGGFGEEDLSASADGSGATEVERN
jgi:hypothetical protein